MEKGSNRLPLPRRGVKKRQTGGTRVPPDPRVEVCILGDGEIARSDEASRPLGWYGKV